MLGLYELKQLVGEIKVSTMAKIGNRIQSNITSDPGHLMGKRQTHKKTSHSWKRKSQLFPTGDIKAARSRHHSKAKTNAKNDPQKTSP